MEADREPTEVELQQLLKRTRLCPSPNPRAMTPEEIHEDPALFVGRSYAWASVGCTEQPHTTSPNAANKHHSCQGLVYPGGGKPLCLGSCTPATPGVTSPAIPPPPPPQIMDLPSSEAGGAYESDLQTRTGQRLV